MRIAGMAAPYGFEPTLRSAGRRARRAVPWPLHMVSRSKHVVHIVMPATAGRTAFAWGTTRVLNAQPAGA